MVPSPGQSLVLVRRGCNGGGMLWFIMMKYKTEQPLNVSSAAASLIHTDFNMSIIESIILIYLHSVQNIKMSQHYRADPDLKEMITSLLTDGRNKR